MLHDAEEVGKHWGGVHNIVPGTKMNSTLRDAATKAAIRIVAVARLLRRVRTYGSRIRAQFRNVYSLKPR